MLRDKECVSRLCGPVNGLSRGLRHLSLHWQMHILASTTATPGTVLPRRARGTDVPSHDQLETRYVERQGVSLKALWTS